jgi:hypothetical protein
VRHSDAPKFTVPHHSGKPDAPYPDVQTRGTSSIQEPRQQFHSRFFLNLHPKAFPAPSNCPLPFNNPHLFVIPTGGEGSAVRHSETPNSPFRTTRGNRMHRTPMSKHEELATSKNPDNIPLPLFPQPASGGVPAPSSRPLPFTNPPLFVIPTGGEGSAVCPSDAPNSPFWSGPTKAIPWLNLPTYICKRSP